MQREHKPDTSLEEDSTLSQLLKMLRSDVSDTRIQAAIELATHDRNRVTLALIGAWTQEDEGLTKSAILRAINMHENPTAKQFREEQQAEWSEKHK